MHPTLDIHSPHAPQRGAWPSSVALAQLRGLASVVAVLSVLQLYLFDLGGIAVNGYMLACLLGGLFMVNQGFVTSRYSVAVMALIALQLLAMVWSPAPDAAIRDAYFGVLFFINLTLVLTLAVCDPAGLALVARRYVLAVLFQSFLVIGFRLLPDVESTFLSSNLARLFISGKALLDLTGGTVGDADKSGGMLLAPNVAGVWALSAAALAVALARAQRWRMGYAVAAVHLVAAALCGSKATLALVLLFPVVLGLGRLRGAARTYGTFALILLGILMFDPLAKLQDAELTGASVRALQSREVMWTFALDSFSSRPLLGLGYGGWGDAFFEVGQAAWEAGASGDLAPHNILVNLWATTGLFGVLLGLVIIAYGLRCMWLATRYNPETGGVLLFGYLAYVLQSMGENYAIYAEPHVAAALALLVALAYVTASRVSRDANAVHLLPKLE